MIQALISVGIFLAMAFAFDRFATSAARGDIRLFAGVAIAAMLLTGLASELRAEPLTGYIGSEWGVDMTQDYKAKHSPQCVEGYQDDATSHGRIYAGVEWGAFYAEVYPWLHKSCAMGDDFMVYDGFGLLIGGRIEFNLLRDL